MPPAIECRQVTVRFDRLAALESIDLELQPGQWAYLVGPSGSGKTTLLRALAGLQSIVSGQVMLEGRLATNRRIAVEPHLRRIGMIFQAPSLWPHLTAEANVALALPEKNRRERLAEARRWLDRLHVADLARRRPGEMSGGQAQRVALARALAGRPRILLLDEPIAHLDLHLREGMMKLLRELHDELKPATLCVTHQIDPPFAESDRLAVLERGRLIYDGRIGNLTSAPDTLFIRALRRSIQRSAE
jgi:ABC-type Fe3+/spermidine/putrescine transport system ATPase subunit